MVDLVLLIVVFGGLAVLGFRWTRRRPTHDDLRRADDAETVMPTAQEVQERIGEAFGQTDSVA